MALPKGFRNNIKLTPQKVGLERREEILQGIEEKGTYLPKGVSIEDMDQSFIQFVGDDAGFAITIDGKKVPVVFLTIQRWSEFTKTWQFTDEYKNIEFPFVTIVRKPDIQAGQNQAGLWNIPGGRTYTYMKIPNWDGGRKGITLYKVPQPTSVDISYEVRFFTNRMKDLNGFSTIIQRAFQSRQCYIDVKGHPMPLLLEEVGDESNIEDFESRRFYIQMFEIKLMGYILDERDFEIMPTINRVLSNFSIVDAASNNSKVLFSRDKTNELITYNIAYPPNSGYVYSFITDTDINLSVLTNLENITRVVISVNSVMVFDGTALPAPIYVPSGSTVLVRVNKQLLSNGKLTLIGNELV